MKNGKRRKMLVPISPERREEYTRRGGGRELPRIDGESFDTHRQLD